MKLVFVAMLLALPAAGGAQPPDTMAQDGTWRIPVGEGTPTREYSVVAEADRSVHIALVEERVFLETEPPRFRQALGGVAVDFAGRVYVTRPLAGVVEVFDAEGAAIRTLGAYSPGSDSVLSEPHSLVTTRERLIVESTRSKLFVWDFEGEFLGMHDVVPGPKWVLAGTDRGEIIAFQRHLVGPLAHRRLFASTITAAETREYFDLSYDEAPTIVMGSRKLYDLWNTNLLVPRDRPSFAASREGVVYAAPVGAYEVVAKEVDGTPLWAIRALQEPSPFQATQPYLDRIFERYRYHPEDGTPQPSDVRWPEYEPAIERIDVDGHGNLYVFPWFDSLSRRGQERPVDVYTPDGDRILTALIPDFDWDDALGDYVYGIAVGPVGPETQIERAVRYRMVLPTNR